MISKGYWVLRPWFMVVFDSCLCTEPNNSQVCFQISHLNTSGSAIFYCSSFLLLLQACKLLLIITEIKLPKKKNETCEPKQQLLLNRTKPRNKSASRYEPPSVDLGRHNYLLGSWEHRSTPQRHGEHKGFKPI